jgi:hypothetical protein
MSNQALRALSMATTVIEQQLAGTDAFQDLAILDEERVNAISDAERNCGFQILLRILRLRFSIIAVFKFPESQHFPQNIAYPVSDHDQA